MLHASNQISFDYYLWYSCEANAYEFVISKCVKYGFSISSNGVGRQVHGCHRIGHQYCRIAMISPVEWNLSIGGARWETQKQFCTYIYCLSILRVRNVASCYIRYACARHIYHHSSFINITISSITPNKLSHSKQLEKKNNVKVKQLKHLGYCETDALQNTKRIEKLYFVFAIFVSLSLFLTRYLICVVATSIQVNVESDLSTRSQWASSINQINAISFFSYEGRYLVSMYTPGNCAALIILVYRISSHRLSYSPIHHPDYF